MASHQRSHSALPFTTRQSPLCRRSISVADSFPSISIFRLRLLAPPSRFLRRQYSPPPSIPIPPHLTAPPLFRHLTAQSDSNSINIRKPLLFPPPSPSTPSLKCLISITGHRLANTNRNSSAEPGVAAPQRSRQINPRRRCNERDGQQCAQLLRPPQPPQPPQPPHIDF